MTRPPVIPDDNLTCAFRTTVPLGAMSQATRRGSPVRYRLCRNKATHTITVTQAGLFGGSTERTVRCCGLHKRMHEERGWLP